MTKPAAIILLLVTAVLGAWALAQTATEPSGKAPAIAGGNPSVSPPVVSGVANTITSFATHHPEWRLLQERRIDTTPLKFGHQEHLNAAWSTMPEKMKIWLQALRDKGVPETAIPAASVTGPDGKAALQLTCAACHEPDSAGRYMLPISFEAHCQACHSLGTRADEPVPHGRAAVTFVKRQALEAAVTPKSAAAAPAASSGGPRRPKTSPAKPEPVTFESKAAMVESLKKDAGDAKDRIDVVIGPLCKKCHDPQADMSQIVDPHIPTRWLPRSVFNHKAHGNMDCLACHAQAQAPPPRIQPPEDDAALAWTGRTKDVMIPGIESCRTCHSPAGNTRSDCVLCHEYHPRGQ